MSRCSSGEKNGQRTVCKLCVATLLPIVVLLSPANRPSQYRGMAIRPVLSDLGPREVRDYLLLVRDDTPTVSNHDAYRNLGVSGRLCGRTL